MRSPGLGFVGGGIILFQLAGCGPLDPTSSLRSNEITQTIFEALGTK